ncbi:hypothetical protein SGPA1_60230 [Streptomyces misionensis JCM 4497]
MPRQEHDRQGRVPAHRRAGAALRGDARRPVERTGSLGGRGLFDHRVQRGVHARRDGAQAALGAAQRRPVPGRPPQYRDGRQRPGVLGEVLQLLGGGGPAGAHGGRALPPGPAGGGRIVRREHHRGRRHPRFDLRRLLRAHRRPVRGPGRAPGAHRPGHPGACRRCLRRDGGAVPGRGPGLGLPAAARGLHQHLRAQVRAGVPGRRLGAVAGRRGAARGPGLPGQLPGRRHADLRAQLLPPRRPGRGAVLQLSAAGPRGLPGGPAVDAGRGPLTGRPDRGPRRLPAAHPRRPAPRVRLHHGRARHGVRRLRRLPPDPGERLAGPGVHLPGQPAGPLGPAHRLPQRLLPRPGRPLPGRPHPPPARAAPPAPPADPGQGGGDELPSLGSLVRTRPDQAAGARRGRSVTAPAAPGRPVRRRSSRRGTRAGCRRDRRAGRSRG